MKRIVAVVTLCVALGGCASQQQRDHQEALITASIPVCHSDRQCEGMWAAARAWVFSNCAMRVQNITADYLQTYPSPHGSPAIACEVSKNPRPDGSYAIESRVSCGNLFGCTPDPFQAVMNFNAQVTGAGAQYAPAKPIPGLHGPEFHMPDVKYPPSP